ncbi:concanavalin A-like lectin/glucanase domain-containing protein, partial [Delphinella strobiligena]
TAIVAASFVSAQTFTDCDPMNKTCTPDTGLGQYTLINNFTGGNGESVFNKNWSKADYTTVTFDDDLGMVFNISKEGQAPTVQTDFYIFFGKIEVVMRSSPGQGIISSVVMESDDLDEIDWEWIGGNNTVAETNYFGKGNTTLYNRATYETVSTPNDDFHTYTVDWTEESIVWGIDGVNVRTLAYADADYGYDFPQTPLRIKLGSWCGGCTGEGEGTIEWSQGKANFDNTPYLMYVKSVAITNYNPAKSYTWSDKTGAYDSIKASNDSSVSTNIVVTSTSSAAVASSTVVTTTDSSGHTVTSSFAASTATGSSSTFSQTSTSNSNSAA